ncbi:hypothetical protein PQG02_32485 (plasmid) [Nostoc sp. UHCC 0926]|nr:hypothetical protein [Nostoc sp. UHCC 0926]WDD36310.1 hypothetical protein PQG02_32485 [Nostoc sp. UHCC 0926]
MPPAGGYAIAHQKQSAFKRCLRRAIRCRPHLFSFVVRRSHLQMIKCDA